MSLICIKTYNSRIDADIAKGLLESHSIKSIVTSDDAGGMSPYLGLTHGAQLLINDTDGDKAKQLLHTAKHSKD